MMETKVLELRDRSTFIPLIAMKMVSTVTPEHNLLRAAGYGMHDCIMIFHASGGEARCDPYEWGDRTYKTAHAFIETHWDLINSGDVIDVEHILGETPTVKSSEVNK